MVYLYNQGSVNSHSSNIQTQCYYEGYVEGYPNSIVILSTCSGLRGLLQFEKVSYGIEPLDIEVEFQHLLYKLKNENKMFSTHTENSRSIEQKPMDYSIFISEKECGLNSCCDPKRCVLKPQSKCDLGLCCSSCQIQPAGTTCRPNAHPDCDVPEVCNGSSATCPADITIINGHSCKTRYLCYNGDCPDLNARCESIFGAGSTNAPFACYEEIQSQLDRFGNCGIERDQYKFCQWRNLICGRLICTYPSRAPFIQHNVAVLYAYVRNVICITLDYSIHGSTIDPMVIRDGSECDTERVCVNRECIVSSLLKRDSASCTAQCNGHGVCTSRRVCRCNSGWTGRDCKTKSREADGGATGSIIERDIWKSAKNRWLLGFYATLPVLLVATIIGITWRRLKKWFSKDKESRSSKSELSIHTYSTRSRSESSQQTDIANSESQENI